MGFRIGVVCSLGVGSARGGRERNEDNFLVCHDGQVRYVESDQEISTQAEGAGALLAVCDGMGGHVDGHIASLTAAKVMSRLFQTRVPANPERALLRYVRDSHAALHFSAAERGPVSMGTTLVIAWLLHGTLTWVNVGDSRLYRYRDDELELLTLDQTRNEFARRDLMTLVPADRDHLAQNFIYGSRGLGDNPGLRLEAGLDSGTCPLDAGDVLLLCSDGLWGVLDPDLISKLLEEVTEPQQAAEQIVELAMAHGSTDNATAIVVTMTAERPPQVDWSDDFDILHTAQ